MVDTVPFFKLCSCGTAEESNSLGRCLGTLVLSSCVGWVPCRGRRSRTVVLSSLIRSQGPDLVLARVKDDSNEFPIPQGRDRVHIVFREAFTTTNVTFAFTYFIAFLTKLNVS